MKNKRVVACLVLCLVCLHRADAVIQAAKAWWQTSGKNRVYAVIGYAATLKSKAVALDKKVTEKKIEFKQRPGSKGVQKTLVPAVKR